jgi:hypothetical protein
MCLLGLVSIESSVNDFLEVVTSKNTSNRAIVSFQLGIIMSAPAACAPKEVFGQERPMPFDRIGVLAPGSTLPTLSYRLSPQDVASFGSRTSAREVHTQVAIVRVDFLDGGSWSMTTYYKIYDREALAKTQNATSSLKGCYVESVRRTKCVIPIFLAVL